MAHPELKPRRFITEAEERELLLELLNRLNRPKNDNGRSNRRITTIPIRSRPIVLAEANSTTVQSLPKESSADAFHPLWRKALHVYSNLPPELCHEIHKYTLTASEAVRLEATGDCHLQCRWREPMAERQLLWRAMNFYAWCDRANDAKAYLLSHNTFIIKNKASANALLSTVQSLSELEYAAHIHGLKVIVSPDPINSAEDDWDDEDSAGREDRTDIGDEDFENDDWRYFGLRAFRILNSLTKLPWLHEVNVIMQSSVEMDEVLLQVGRENPATWMFGAAIAKIKDLVAASSKGWKFKVRQLCVEDEDELDEDSDNDDDNYGNDEDEDDDVDDEEDEDDDDDEEDGDNDNDLTWVWNAPSEEDLKRMKKYTESRAKADKIHLRIAEMDRAIHRDADEWDSGRHRKIHYDKLKQERENLNKKLKELMSPIEKLSSEEQRLVERCCVSEMAADLNWEKAVETIAKRRPPSSDYWQPANLAEFNEDEFPGERWVYKTDEEYQEYWRNHPVHESLGPSRSLESLESSGPLGLLGSFGSSGSSGSSEDSEDSEYPEFRPWRSFYGDDDYLDYSD